MVHDQHDPSTGTGESASASASKSQPVNAHPSGFHRDALKRGPTPMEVDVDLDRQKDREDRSDSPRSDRAVRDDSILHRGTVSRASSPARSDREEANQHPENPDTSTFGAGANDHDLHRQAERLRISLSPPPSAHVPPPEETKPEDVMKLGPPEDEPIKEVKGAAAGEGEKGGVSREPIESEHPEGQDPDSGHQSDGDESTEPQVGSPNSHKDTRENGPGPGTGGKDDHCGPSEGIGVGMPKDRPTKASTAKKQKGQSGSGSAGGSEASGSGSGRGSGSGAGYDASASADSSAPPQQANGNPDEKAMGKHDDRRGSDSRSRSMAPEPEISPPQDDRGSGSQSQPTASKPRKQPKEGEEGGGMLPPAAPASSGHYNHHRRGTVRPHGKGRAIPEEGEEDDEAEKAKANDGRGQSSAGPDDSVAQANQVSSPPKRRAPLQQVASASSADPLPSTSHARGHGRVEMMDPKTSRYINVARAPGVAQKGEHLQAHPIGYAGGRAQVDAVKRQAEELMSREEAEAMMRGKQQVGVGMEKQGGQEVMRVDATPGVFQAPAIKAGARGGGEGSNEDSSGTEGWFRTLNYHYRPPPHNNASGEGTSPAAHGGAGREGEESEETPPSAAEGKGEPKARWRRGESSDGMVDQDAATAEALRVIAARRRQQQQQQQAAAQQQQGSRSSSMARTRSQEERLGLAPGGGSFEWPREWENLPPHLRRVMMAQQLGRMGVTGAPVMSQHPTPVAGPSRSPRHHHHHRHAHSSRSPLGNNQAGISLPAASGAESQRQSPSMRSSSRRRLFGNDSDDNDATFREIVDDLTIQNKVLKSRLRRYEPAKQPRDMKKERLFEVRFFEGLAPDRRKELEGFLTAFVQSLYEPPEGYESGANRSMSRSMPSISAIHNSSDAERAHLSSGGEASEPAPPPMRSGAPAMGEHPQAGPSSQKQPNASGTGSGEGSGVATSGQPLNKDSGYGSLASGASMAGQSNQKGEQQDQAQRATHEAQVQQQHQQRPRRSDQHRLAEASFSGYEPPSATGTGTGMKITPPHDNAASEWASEQQPQPSTSKRKRDYDSFPEVYGNDGDTVEKGKAVAGAVEKLFHDSTIALNGGSAVGDVDPMPLPKEAGTNRAYLRNLLEGTGASGWIYLNLAFGMAQLHRFNVPIPFVQSALRQYAPTLELSVDGRKIRRRQHGDLVEGTSDSQGTGSSIRKSSALGTGSASDQAGSIPRAGTSTNPTAQSTAQTSIEPSKDGSSAVKGRGEDSLDSAEGSQPIIRGPDYRLLTEQKEGPAIKRLKTSHDKAAQDSKSSSVYVPLFDHGADSDSTQGSRFESSAHLSGGTAQSEAQKRAVGEGTVSFFSGGMFCSDMSSEPPRLAERGSRQAEHYTIGIDSVVEPEVAPPSEVKQYDHTFLRRPSPAFERALEKVGAVDPSLFDQAATSIRFFVGSLNESERATIELEALVSTGMTNMVISDNFSLIATMAYIASEGERPVPKRKYGALDLSPAADLEALVRDSKRRRGSAVAGRPGRYFTYRTLTERPISHIPSTRQRFLANPYSLDSEDDEYNDDSQASPESDHELSPPEGEPMQGLLRRRSGLSESPEGDYNMSLRLPFVWSRPQDWSDDDDDNDDDAVLPPSHAVQGPGVGGVGGAVPFQLDLEEHRKLSAPGPASSALATPSSEEGPPQQMRRGSYGLGRAVMGNGAPMEVDE